MINVRSEATFTCDVCGYAVVTVDDGPRRIEADNTIRGLHFILPEGWRGELFGTSLICKSCLEVIDQAVADAETQARRELSASRKEAVT